VEAMARALAKEISPRIRINIVSPGTINTPMVTLTGTEREKLYESMTKDNLIPRAGTSEEVAEALMYVVKNNFVTGTTVDVDGGWLLS
jgi:NAD(P)-dependent dehydrogenase (short-subunit alcohol dehydrogenase family)